LNIDDRCLLARQILYSAIQQLQTQADLNQAEATRLLAGYAVGMAAFLTDDPEDLLADCEGAIMAGVKSRREFESNHRSAA
jgi:hypothetical protein